MRCPAVSLSEILQFKCWERSSDLFLFIHLKGLTMENTNLVVNWHLLEPCQLKCKYCYAEWKKSDLPLLYREEQKSNALIREIASLANNRQVRLSFAGGEPLLDNKISQKIKSASEQSLKISIITNGDFLTRKLPDDDLLKLSMLGVSIDSFNSFKNIAIGRATVSRRMPDYNEIIAYLQHAKQLNPHLKIKINTVVNPFNWNDDLSEKIEKISPDKWKILRVLPATKKSTQFSITNEQFEAFKLKHRHLPYAQFEDNTDMLNSYLMIDPYGRFFFNIAKGYGYSDPIIEVGIDNALKQIKFDETKFINRYEGGVQ